MKNQKFISKQNELQLLVAFRNLSEQSKEEIIDLCRIKADREKFHQSPGKIISMGKERR